MFKLLMTWNIRPGREREHLEFFEREFKPGLAKLGVHYHDAWYTYYGDHPHMLMGGIVEDIGSLQSALSSDEWRRLKEELLTHVTDYSQKIIHASGGFQL